MPKMPKRVVLPLAAIILGCVPVAAQTVLHDTAATSPAVETAVGAQIAPGQQDVTVYGCVFRGEIIKVSVTKAPSCPRWSYPIQWAAQVPGSSPSPSPTPTSPSPSPTPTSPSPSPTPTSPSPSPSPTGTPCVVSGLESTCGPYNYPPITNSNGFTTYVSNNKWGCGNPDQCGLQTITATDPGNWNVVSNQAAGNTAVLTYPNVQQVYTLTSNENPPLGAFTSITSDFTEAMNATSGTIAEAAYDIWLSGTSGPNEVMIWVDNANRGSGGGTQVGTGSFGGQSWTLYQNGGGELIWSLNQNEQSGSIDILAMLQDLQSRGLVSAGADIGQVDFGWEICSTGGVPETFTVSRYALTSSCASGQTCMG